MSDDVERMLICSVCGGDACFGFWVTVEGIGMGDVGYWCCAEHAPDPKPRLSMAEWAAIHAADMPVDQASEAAE